MGGERPGNRLGHSLSTMQIAPHRISANDAEVYDALARERSVRPQNFPKGILLPGLPQYVGEGWRPAASTRRLGDFFLDGHRPAAAAQPRGRRDATGNARPRCDMI